MESLLYVEVMPEFPCDTSFFKTQVMVGYILFLFPYVSPTFSVKFNNSKCCDRYYVCTVLMKKCHIQLTKTKNKTIVSPVLTYMLNSVLAEKKVGLKKFGPRYYIMINIIILLLSLSSYAPAAFNNAVTTCNTSNGKNYEMAN